MVCHPDAVLADLASAQHGRVARRQLLARAISRHWIDHRVASGHLIKEYAGVYVVGHQTSTIAGRMMGAVLACGPRGSIGQLSGLMALRILPYAPGTLHVVVPPGSLRAHKGVAVHRADLWPSELTEVGGIPCTTAVRALMDSAPLLSRRELERACDEAAFLKLLSPTRARRYLRARAGHRGAALLRSVLDEHAIGTTRTMSELEERFLALCDAAGFPRPIVNRRTQTADGVPKLDFVWYAFRLVVETDGRAAHDILTVERRDAERDAALSTADFRVLRFTWWDVVHDAARVTAILRPLLAA
ncbi:MAG: hypothetical protein JWO02_2439 [Solirubrobacterales bacterium]|nr:hypothetical protein [Solirubrobacterales bacterium]